MQGKTILTKDQLNQRKEEAREKEIRQNVKSHCTKICDGISKNGSASGNRAIWELFQNAGDLATAKSAEIKITITDNEFIFAHKGKSFTYDSLCSLVKQVSSQEKENEETVGQYGTGFLTTHTFGRKININGSMRISDEPLVYVDIDNFIIDRNNFDDIPQFIDDMTRQIKKVDDLMNAEQKYKPREWTELCYELNENRKTIAQNAIDESAKLMPYVLTFNDQIGSCEIYDFTRNRRISFSKEEKTCNTQDLLCKRIIIKENDKNPENFDCFYLEMHNGDSRIILPLKSETQVCSLGNTPRLFVHFPLIGQNYFGVNFLFHSHRFTPEEPRDNIIVPRGNEATQKSADSNKTILDEMTRELWTFLENNVHTWNDSIKMASLRIKDSGYTEKETEEYYKNLKSCWVEEFKKLKLIDINGEKYSMSDINHPLVLVSDLERFISGKIEKNYLSIIHPYIKDMGLIPCKDELLEWSCIISEWDSKQEEYFLTLEQIIEHISQNKGENLHNILSMVVDAGHDIYFDKYAILPNREGILKKREELRDAKAIVKDLYDLVKPIDSKICDKFVDEKYADIISLTPYDRSQLRNELGSAIKAYEDEFWKKRKEYYSGEFEKKLIDLCSAFTTINGDSKRNKLMPIICRFEGLDYKEKHIPAWSEDSPSLDIYRTAFLSLAENQMMKIQQRDPEWVKQNMVDLISFVDNARGDDYKNFCTQYAIYPDMNGELHKPEELKRNCNVPQELFEIYQQVLTEDLKSKCVDGNFEKFYPNFQEYTAKSVANEVQNKLSSDKYQNTILLDIIELTEMETSEGLEWRALFKDIYDRRESIRYNLGSDAERKAINKMLKQKNPALIERMADVAERVDANIVLKEIEATINSIEHEEYIKLLGYYAENCIQNFLTEMLKPAGVTVRNQQGGQDFILSKEGYEDYHVEVKSRWKSEQSVEMTPTQFERAVAIPERYALIGMNMYNFDKERAEKNELASLQELQPLTKVLDNIGTLESELHERASEIFSWSDTDIKLQGSYTVRVPQKIFDAHRLDFTGFVEKLKERFTTTRISSKQESRLTLLQEEDM